METGLLAIEAPSEKCDIAEASLRCAVGLPGAEDLDVERYLSVLTLWTKRVLAQTSKHLNVFRNNPAKYENSEGFWRVLALTATLRDEFSIRYNMERLEKEDWSDSRDILIHGLLGPKRMGTCASLPVLIVAIGRRLGYPLFLVYTTGHVFVRWESADKKERFNIEFNGDGMSRHSDDYYREWPTRWTPELLALEFQRGEKCAFLRNLTPAEELAHALRSRGLCLESVGRWEEALLAYEAAVRFAPHHPGHALHRDELKSKMRSADDLMTQVIAKTPGFNPELTATVHITTVPIPRGFTIALSSYMQPPHPGAPIGPTFKASGVSPALLHVRKIVNQLAAHYHPLAGFRPTTPPTNI